MRAQTWFCIVFLLMSYLGCGGRSSPRVGQKIVFVEQTSATARERGYYRGWNFLVAEITDLNGDTMKLTNQYAGTDQYGGGDEIQIKSLDGSKLNYTVLSGSLSKLTPPAAYLIENPEQQPQAGDVIIGTNNVLDKAAPRTYWPFYVVRVESGKPIYSFRDVESGSYLSKEEWNRIGDANLQLRNYVVAPRELANALCGRALGCAP